MYNFQLELFTEFEKGSDEELQVIKNFKDKIKEIEKVDVNFKVDNNTNIKSLGQIDWNNIIITLISSGGVVTSTIMLIRKWIESKSKRKVILKIGNNQYNFTGMGDKEIEKIIKSTKGK